MIKLFLIVLFTVTVAEVKCQQNCKFDSTDKDSSVAINTTNNQTLVILVI
jgi:hypothetical protein